MNNYYNSQITEYKNNYKKSYDEINEIYNLLNNLYTSFSTARGEDIDRIRKDIEEIASELNTIKTNITNAKNKTIQHAYNSDGVYILAKELKSTPTFKGANDVYESLGDKNIYIKDGIIYWSESFRKIPKSSYDSLLGGVAALGKLFNSYPIIKTTTHQDVNLMIEGVVNFVP